MTRTLGPWTHDEERDTVIGADGFPVASVDAMPVLPGWADLGVGHWAEAPGRAYIERDEEEVWANGRLLAAAPQLLGGLQAAVAALEQLGASGSPAGAELLEGLRGVLDLAEQEDAEPPLVVVLSEHARRTVETIQRSGETEEATINRILETLCASSPDFDHFYGEPRDGRGPSGA
jgi:hypothetical protein